MLAYPLTPAGPPVSCGFPTPKDQVTGPAVTNPAFPLQRPTSPAQSPARKRPKLSLQTSNVPLGFVPTSTASALSVSAGAGHPVSSPTVLNTFHNTYQLPHRSSPISGPISPAGPKSARLPPRLVSPFALGPMSKGRPYQLPSGVKGILRNGPIPCSLNLRSASLSLYPQSPSSPRSGRRVRFPAAKKVSFRAVLDEEIQTTTFIAKHSDLVPSNRLGRGSFPIPLTPPCLSSTSMEEKSVFESDSDDDDGEEEEEDDQDDHLNFCPGENEVDRGDTHADTNIIPSLNDDTPSAIQSSP